VRLRIKNNNEVDLFNEFTSDCNNCINTCASNSTKLICPIYSEERRIGKISNEFGEVFGCTNNRDLLSSSKSFKKKTKFYFIRLE
jgi:hypothetical protein